MFLPLLLEILVFSLLNEGNFILTCGFLHQQLLLQLLSFGDGQAWGCLLITNSSFVLLDLSICLLISLCLST